MSRDMSLTEFKFKFSKVKPKEIEEQPIDPSITFEEARENISLFPDGSDLTKLDEEKEKIRPYAWLKLNALRHEDKWTAPETFQTSLGNFWMNERLVELKEKVDDLVECDCAVQTIDSANTTTGAIFPSIDIAVFQEVTPEIEGAVKLLAKKLAKTDTKERKHGYGFYISVSENPFSRTTKFDMHVEELINNYLTDRNFRREEIAEARKIEKAKSEIQHLREVHKQRKFETLAEEYENDTLAFTIRLENIGKTFCYNCEQVISLPKNRNPEKRFCPHCRTSVGNSTYHVDSFMESQFRSDLIKSAEKEVESWNEDPIEDILMKFQRIDLLPFIEA